MASISNGQGERDSNAKAEASAANGELLVASMASLLETHLEKHRETMLAELKSTVATLETKFDQIHSMVSELVQKITSIEANASLQDTRIQALETSCASMAESHAKLQAEVIDLECRSRRNNIRIVGVPESVEGSRPTAFFSELLAEVFGSDVMPAPPELEGAHRTCTAKPRAGERPRTVIVRLHRYQEKEKIVREARLRRGKLQYRGSPIAVYEDFAPEVMEQRNNYREHPPNQWPVYNVQTTAAYAQLAPQRPIDQYNNAPAESLPDSVGLNLSLARALNGEVLNQVSAERAPDNAAPPGSMHRLTCIPRKRHLERQKQVNTPYVKKPPNAFMLFMKEQRPLVGDKLTCQGSSVVNKVLAQRWRSLSEKEQAPYYEEAEKEKMLHAQQHPGWSNRENYGKMKKRSKGKAFIVSPDQA